MNPELVFQPERVSSGTRVDTLTLLEIVTYDAALQNLLEIVDDTYPHLGATAEFGCKLSGKNFYISGEEEMGGILSSFGLTGLDNLVVYLKNSLEDIALKRPNAFWVLTCGRKIPSPQTDYLYGDYSPGAEKAWDSWQNSSDGRRYHSFSARGFNKRVAQVGLLLFRKGPPNSVDKPDGLEVWINDQGEAYSLRATRYQPNSSTPSLRLIK